MIFVKVAHQASVHKEGVGDSLMLALTLIYLVYPVDPCNVIY